MGCCMSCGCLACFMDSYLHVYVRGIEDAKFKGDLNIRGTVDVSVRIKVGNKAQDTRIANGEIQSVQFNEPLILEDVEIGDGVEPNKLEIEVWDVDNTTADDLLATGHYILPDKSGFNVGETNIALYDPKKKERNGTLILDQIHWVEQRVRRYTGPCKCCCCCLARGEVKQAGYAKADNAPPAEAEEN